MVLTEFCEKFSLLFAFCSNFAQNLIIILTLVTIKSTFYLTQNGVMLLKWIITQIGVLAECNDYKSRYIYIFLLNSFRSVER